MKNVGRIYKLFEISNPLKKYKEIFSKQVFQSFVLMIQGFSLTSTAISCAFVSKKLLMGKSNGLIKKMAGLLIELGVADLLTKKKVAEAPVAAAVEKIPAVEQEKV